MFPGYQVGWHHRLIIKRLEQLQSGAITRLIVNCPPRHGKSELVSRQFPAWALGLNPNEQIIACSYNGDTAKDFNRDVQNIMLSPPYIRTMPGTRLNSREVVNDGSAVKLRNSRVFEVLNARGAYRAAGVGGGITGKGMTLGIIDDPIKNHDEAYSPTYREKVWSWYTSTFLSRSEGAFSEGGDARIVVCVTRWHEDDLVGRLLEKEGHLWTVVDLPALLDREPSKGDPRAQGDALWPAKYSKTWLEGQRDRLGPRDWLSLYQQAPYDVAGGMFKRDWWQYYDHLPERFDKVFTSWDMTFKDTKAGSFIVGQVWGRRGADMFLLHQVRFRGDFVEAHDAFVMVAAKFPGCRGHLIEDKANGPAVVSSLKRHVSGVIAVAVKGSKEARASSITPFVRAGNVHLPRHAPWVPAYIAEHSAFPKGRHDDQVDATSMALDWGGSASLESWRNLLKL